MWENWFVDGNVFDLSANKVTKISIFFLVEKIFNKILKLDNLQK